MAYLPGVPDEAPAPVSTAPAAPSGGGIAATARSVGKPGRTEHLGSVVGRRGAGITSIGGGDPAMHSLNHYGKNAPPLMGGAQNVAGIDPTAHAGAKMIRGGTGQMRSHVREGGLGPGKMSTPGPSDTNYSMSNNEDME